MAKKKVVFEMTYRVWKEKYGEVGHTVDAFTVFAANNAEGLKRVEESFDLSEYQALLKEAKEVRDS